MIILSYFYSILALLYTFILIHKKEITSNFSPLISVDNPPHSAKASRGRPVINSQSTS